MNKGPKREIKLD